MSEPAKTTGRVLQERLIVARNAIIEAQQIALTLPTDVDDEATRHIPQALAAAEHEIRGAFYAMAALENSMRGLP